MSHSLSLFYLPGKQHGFKQNNTVFGLLLNNSTALMLNVPHKCTANNIIGPPLSAPGPVLLNNRRSILNISLDFFKFTLAVLSGMGQVL